MTYSQLISRTVYAYEGILFDRGSSLHGLRLHHDHFIDVVHRYALDYLNLSLLDISETSDHPPIEFDRGKIIKMWRHYGSQYSYECRDDLLDILTDEILKEAEEEKEYTDIPF
jgi:hypothetical protein